MKGYGAVSNEDFMNIKIKLQQIIEDIDDSETYGEVYTHFKKFVRKMAKLPDETPKCWAWKEAFKGAGGYYSLVNMILFHDCLLKGCRTKNESMEKLDDYLEIYRHETWKFHYLMKEAIAFNGFDLASSIESRK